jgi:hypothetical protein
LRRPALPVPPLPHFRCREARHRSGRQGFHSRYYRWKRKVDRWGLEALRIRERRRPWMSNQIGPHLEQCVIAFCLGHPGLGPRRVSAELAREK